MIKSEEGLEDMPQELLVSIIRVLMKRLERDEIALRYLRDELRVMGEAQQLICDLDKHFKCMNGLYLYAKKALDG